MPDHPRGWPTTFTEPRRRIHRVPERGERDSGFGRAGCDGDGDRAHLDGTGGSRQVLEADAKSTDKRTAIGVIERKRLGSIGLLQPFALASAISSSVDSAVRSSSCWNAVILDFSFLAHRVGQKKPVFFSGQHEVGLTRDWWTSDRRR